MIPHRTYIVATLFLCFGLVAPSAACAEKSKSRKSKITTGWVEKVTLGPATFKLNAKLDTGADNCSIHASSLKSFEQDDERWVRFNVKNSEGESVSIERPVLRIARVKRKNRASQKRPTVMLDICVGNVHKEVEFTLANRGNFDYPALIGRNFLSGIILVDSSRKFTVDPTCPKGSPK